MKSENNPATYQTDRALVISISDSDQSIMTAFYLLIETGDTSHQAFELSEKVLNLNSASYTAWLWRRKCIINDLCVDHLLSELTFADSWCIRNPKNYQVWYHRRWLFERIQAIAPERVPDIVSSELERVAELITAEPKHYNAWTHRLFLATRFGLLSSLPELEVSAEMIDLDPRNNSAWSYRRHLINFHSLIVPHEISFTLSRINIAPNNESAWAYLRSLDGWSNNSGVQEVIESIVDKASRLTPPFSSYRDATETLAILHEMRESRDVSASLLVQLSGADSVRQKSLLHRSKQVVV